MMRHWKILNLLKIIFVLLINLLCAVAPERNGEIMFQASKLTETFVRKAKIIHNTCDFTCLYVFDETSGQGRIYVANEYPTFARTMSMDGQKLTFLRQITLNVRQNLSVLMKNMQILG